MPRRWPIIGMTLLVAAMSLTTAGRAQSQPRIGLLSAGADPARPIAWTAFFEGMRELGYIEGRNVVYLRGFAEGRAERLPDLLSDLVRERVDVIVTTGGREALMAQAATRTTPIVFMTVPDPVALGLVKSLGQPGGNVTGLTDLVDGVGEKYVQLLHEVVPRVTRVAVMATPPNPRPTLWQELATAARVVNMALINTPVKSGDELHAVLERARKDGVEAVVVPLDAVTFLHRARLAASLMRLRLPTIYGSREYIDAGGLMSYGSPFAERARRAATYVDRILRGAKPADLPVEQPTRFELVVNLKAARAIGLTVPTTVLARADVVVE
jgi:ABC-type uncharacterized transport system substrate-binding protein